MKLWPITIRAFEPRRMDLAARACDDFGEARIEAVDNILALAGASFSGLLDSNSERANTLAKEPLDFSVVERPENQD